MCLCVNHLHTVEKRSLTLTDPVQPLAFHFVFIDQSHLVTVLNAPSPLDLWMCVSSSNT